MRLTVYLLLVVKLFFPLVTDGAPFEEEEGDG